MVLKPGNNLSASSFDTAAVMMTSWPCFQLTGVATLYLAVICMESSTRRISSKLRPVVIGYVSISLIFLSGPMTKTERTVALVAAVRPSEVPGSSAGSILYVLATDRSVSPIIGLFTAAPWVSSMSAAHLLWSATGSIERPISWAFRFVNSDSILAM